MSSASEQLAGAERTLDERGHRLGRVQVAVARSGIVVGFPRDPMIHVSWWAVAAFAALAWLLRRRSARG